MRNLEAGKLSSVLLTLALGLTVVRPSSGISVALTPSASSPTPVGTAVVFNASVPDATGPNLWYRFRVRPQGGSYEIVRDYGPNSTLQWTAAKHEGLYELEVSARDLDSGDRSTTTALYNFQSQVTSNLAVVTPTSNSLVFLYSAPACAGDSRMQVQFQSAGGAVQKTPNQTCDPGLSMNFYLAGLLPNTTYTAHHVLNTGVAIVTSSDTTFTTGSVPANLYNDNVLIPHKKTVADGILLGGPLGANSVANDLSGNVLWYGPGDVTFLTRVEAGGVFWGILEAPGSDRTQQIIRKFDLLGMTLLETNAARVNEQLLALGKRQITGFHHEARSLSNGRIAVIAGVEQILTDVQGAGDVDVLGDMIVVLDRNLNVVWSWDAFDNLDTSRLAILRETCPNAGCPAFYLASAANDWTHSNAIQETADGNLLLSMRNQDWVIKISYASGTGDGHIIWKLGIDGDFQINSTDSFPWFSHQHDANFESADPTKFLVFDDGNTRVTAQHGGNSRGQVYVLDEPNRFITPLLNADLGFYSQAVGSAQVLRSGNFHFDAGFVLENTTIDSYSIEFDPEGRIQYEAHQNVVLYRTFRMTDMYTPN